MAAYVIANIDVKDAVGYEEYKKLTAPSIEKYGGRYVVRGGNFQVLEGRWKPARLAVLEFPSAEQARRWYDSEEYAKAKAIRMRTAEADLVIVEGV